MWDLSTRGGELQSDQKSNLPQNQRFFNYKSCTSQLATNIR